MASNRCRRIVPTLGMASVCHRASRVERRTGNARQSFRCARPDDAQHAELGGAIREFGAFAD